MDSIKLPIVGVSEGGKSPLVEIFLDMEQFWGLIVHPITTLAQNFALINGLYMKESMNPTDSWFTNPARLGLALHD